MTIETETVIRKSAEAYALNTFNFRLLGEETSGDHFLRVVSDLASALIETEGRNEDRTNPVAISLSQFEELAKRSRQKRNEKTIDQAENTATEKLLEVIKSQPDIFVLEADFSPGGIPEKIIWQKLVPLWPEIVPTINKAILWVSPPSNERGQEEKHEARFCFYFKGIINNEPYLIMFSVCGQQDARECLSLANSFHPSESIQDAESLRERPFGLSFYQESMWKIIAQNFDSEVLTSAITSGKCFLNKIKAYEIAEQTYLKIRRYLLAARTESDFFWAGVATERALYYFGGERTSLSSCGKSYEEVLKTYAPYTNPFGDQSWRMEAIASKNAVLHSSGGETGKLIEKCGACGHPLNCYMTKGDTCPHCKGVYQGC